MATLDELEASLRAKWDRDVLSVYADHLQARGELRGELIAIDLRIEEAGPLPELVARRKELLAAWLPTLPPGKVQHGFLDVDATGADPVGQVRAAVASPGFPYIRTLVVAGPPRVLREAVAVIGMTPRPALVRVVLRQWNEDPGHAIEPATFTAFAAATPNLETLEVDGYTVIREAVHPMVRRLRISGWSAIESLHGRGPGWPNLTDLDFAFACHLGRPASAMPMFGELLPRRRVGAVRSLDLSRNEPGRTDPNNLGADVAIFKFLREVGILDQVRTLRVPTVSNETKRADLRAALARMPQLETLAIREGGLGRTITHPTARITLF